MQEQLLTTIRQARLHLQRGNRQQAMALLEDARVLARGNPAMLGEILPDLADCYDTVGRADDAYLLRSQLAEMRGQPPPAPGGSSQVAVCVASGRRKWWLAGVLLGAVAIAGAVGASLYLLHRKAVKSYSSTPTAVSDCVGLLVRTARYTGEVDGRNVSVEVPLRRGACVAVHRGGLVVCLRALTEDTPDTAPPANLTEFPDLALRDTAVRLRFGGPGSSFEPADIVAPVEGTDLVLMRVSRTFDRVVRLSMTPPASGQAVRVIGYPGTMGGLGPGCEPTLVAEVLGRELKRADRVTLEAWLPSGAMPSFESQTSVIVADAGPGNPPALRLSAPVAGAHAGSLLVNEFDHLVGIVTAPDGSAIAVTGSAEQLERAMPAL